MPIINQIVENAINAGSSDIHLEENKAIAVRINSDIRISEQKLSPENYPCYKIALDYAKIGGSYMSILSGADEAAVELFLKNKIKFTDIYTIIEEELINHYLLQNPNFNDLISLAKQTYDKIISKYNN